MLGVGEEAKIRHLGRCRKFHLHRFILLWEEDMFYFLGSTFSLVVRDIFSIVF